MRKVFWNDSSEGLPTCYDGTIFATSESRWPSWGFQIFPQESHKKNVLLCSPRVLISFIADWLLGTKYICFRPQFLFTPVVTSVTKNVINSVVTTTPATTHTTAVISKNACAWDQSFLDFQNWFWSKRQAHEHNNRQLGLKKTKKLFPGLFRTSSSMFRETCEHWASVTEYILAVRCFTSESVLPSVNRYYLVD